MTPGERRRVQFLFGALGAVPVFLCAWLGWLQVLQAGKLKRPGLEPLRLGPATANAQRERHDRLPAARGSIVGRFGEVLAIDCDAFDVRAEVHPSRKAREGCREMRIYCSDLADRLATALANDATLADRGAARTQHAERLRRRLAAEFGLDALPADGDLPKDFPARGDILVDTQVDSLAVVEALQALDDQMASVHLQLLHTHVRNYPERDLTFGLVGYLEDRPLVDPRSRRQVGFVAAAPLGLEALAALAPGAPGARTFGVDSTSHPYFTGGGDAPAPPSRVDTTLDLELQKVATRELEHEALAAGKDGAANLPEWGALVLVEIATGDLLAAASWHRDSKSPKGAACAPYQLTYEPGSIVKPLVFAFALQNAGLDWNREYDCSSTGADNHIKVPETGRLVRDDHRCGVLTPHGIIVNSSNIGAVRVGSLLTRDQWREYLRAYGFGRTLDLSLLAEQTGGWPKIAWNPSVPISQFKLYTGSSLSIGYELRVNALQIARAYLSLFSGRSRELRLVRALDVDGQHFDVPAAAPTPRFLDPAVVEAVTDAMVDVVSDDPHATGKHLVELFHKESVELHGLIAGKTGTAVSHSVVKGRGTVEVRNASFVGIAPASAPRYLAVCVLQKDDSARFYGGSYAAPPVARLLLEALRLEERRRLRREPQVSASPGGSGRSRGAPETSQAGR